MWLATSRSSGRSVTTIRVPFPAVAEARDEQDREPRLYGELYVT